MRATDSNPTGAGSPLSNGSDHARTDEPTPIVLHRESRGYDPSERAERVRTGEVVQPYPQHRASYRDDSGRFQAVWIRTAEGDRVRVDDSATGESAVVFNLSAARSAIRNRLKGGPLEPTREHTLDRISGAMMPDRNRKGSATYLSQASRAEEKRARAIRAARSAESRVLRALERVQREISEPEQR